MSRSDGLSGRWQTTVVLKRDVFSTVERGTFRRDGGDVPGVLRRLDEVPWWSRPLAYHLFNRERRALASATPLGVAPPLLYADNRKLVRGYIPGSAQAFKPLANGISFLLTWALKRLYPTRALEGLERKW